MCCAYTDNDRMCVVTTHVAIFSAATLGLVRVATKNAARCIIHRELFQYAFCICLNVYRATAVRGCSYMSLLMPLQCAVLCGRNACYSMPVSSSYSHIILWHDVCATVAHTFTSWLSLDTLDCVTHDICEHAAELLCPWLRIRYANESCMQLIICMKLYWDTRSI